MSEVSVFDAADEIPPQIERRIRALVASEWTDVDDENASGPLTEADLHPVVFVLTSGDVVLSYGRTIWAWVPHDGGALKVYGLGDVVTAPERRRSDYGRRIVEAATAHIRSDSEADLAALLTEPALESWYGRHGWARVPGLRVRTGEYEDAESAGALPMFLVLSTAFDTSPAEVADRTLTLPGDEW